MALIDETACELLEIDNDSKPEEVLRALHLAERLTTRVQELRQQFDAAMMEWLLKHGELEEGEVRWYVGHSKRTTCRNPAATLNTLFDLCKGDMSRVCEYFSSSPFKYGSIKDLMGSKKVFSEHFDLIPVTDVRTGKPRRKVTKTDSRFTKGNK